MQILDEPKHERFAQALATGKSIIFASRLAGFLTPQYELSRADHIKSRVAEILEAAATQAVMDSREWQERETRRARVDPREFFDLQTLMLLPMTEWPDAACEALESIEFDAKGGFKIKLAKTSAMNNLGKMHKMLTDKVELNASVSAEIKSINSTMTPQEAAEVYAAMLNPGQ